MMMAENEARKPAEEETLPSAPDEDEAPVLPKPDPTTCKAIAISKEMFQKAVVDGEFDGTELEYYLEPAGVLHARLVCSRSAGNERRPAGLLMTRAAWLARTAFLDDGVNPEKYELSFPKEVGYVKPVSHYRPQSRERALYPWSKRF